ncbi:MAG: hypothetical protein ACJATN_002372 [Neolewinella sp.]|jgi:hypothetical protein
MEGLISTYLTWLVGQDELIGQVYNHVSPFLRKGAGREL